MINQIKQLLADKAYTQTQIAKEIGYTGGALSAYLKGTYNGDNDKLEAALADWLSAREKKTQQFIEAPAFIETTTAKQIFGDLDFVKYLGGIAIIYGASGVGKTKAAQQYRNSHANVWMITVSPSRSSLNEVLYEMALALNMNDAPRRKGKLSRELERKLTGTEGLMIIDEADHLPYDALEEIRIMQEATGIGFVLIGNDKVYNRMRGGTNQAHEFARLWSRIATKTSIQKSKKTDIKAVAEAWGLDLTNKQLMQALYEIGGAGGGLRALTQYLKLAGMTARSAGTAITLELILGARAQMEGKQ